MEGCGCPGTKTATLTEPSVASLLQLFIHNRGSSGFFRVLSGLVLGASVPAGPLSSQGLHLFKAVQHTHLSPVGVKLELKRERQSGKTKIQIPVLFFLRVPPALPLLGHPCRPEEGVFYGKHGPPSAFDRGSKLITGLAGAESTSGAKGAVERLLEEGEGTRNGVLGSSEKILVAAIVPKKLELVKKNLTSSVYKVPGGEVLT